MAKLVRKIMFDDIFAIGRNESWFCDMSKEGLHLKKYGKTFAYFEKGEAKNMRYRIDILENEPSEEQLDIYRDCGWNLVSNNKQFYIFSSDKAENSLELHTDPIEQSYTLVECNKRLWFNTIVMILLMILFLAMIFSIYIFNDEPYLYIITGLFAQQMLLVLVELYVFYSVLKNYMSISKIKKSLSMGKLINHKEDWKRARVVNAIIASVMLTIAVFSIILPVIEMTQSEDYPISEGSNNLPAIRLADIERNPNLIIEEDESVVEYDWSLIAPIQYDIREYGKIEGEVWGDSKHEYLPSVYTKFYSLGFEGLSEKLIADLISRNVYNDDLQVKEILSESLDKVYIVNDSIKKYVFASLKNKVIFVAYYGKEDISEVLNLVEDILPSYK